jgi:translation initiation factor 4A
LNNNTNNNSNNNNMQTTTQDVQSSNNSEKSQPVICNDTELPSECEDFESMDLRPELFRGILSYGFEKPSAIQRQAIPAFFKKRDIIAQAQSGTGKTATFSISILQNIDVGLKELQAVVIGPTRELAEQIYTVMKALGQFMGITIMLISGGVPVRQNVEDIANLKPQIVIATPGRLVHLLRDAYLMTKHIRMLVMDEADEMLSSGFQDQIRMLIEKMPENLQIGLYSATVTSEMEFIANKFMRDPLQIRVKSQELTLDGIKQFYVAIDNDPYKKNTLIDLFSEIPVYQMMIYCNSKRNTDVLWRQLQEESIPCAAIHSELSNPDRTSIMNKFRSGEIRVLITTDLLCRGIDVQQVSLVINFDFPRQQESYIHRIGRSGRFGRKGYAINLITRNDIFMVKKVEQFYETEIVELPENIKEALGGGN